MQAYGRTADGGGLAGLCRARRKEAEERRGEAEHQPVLKVLYISELEGESAGPTRPGTSLRPPACLPPLVFSCVLLSHLLAFLLHRQPRGLPFPLASDSTGLHLAGGQLPWTPLRQHTAWDKLKEFEWLALASPLSFSVFF